ncbi:MAG: PTS sugar transporter subunit IIA [Rhodobacteraceae bacterium]|nr:PTS sugar transporter subunit IIA [Paracoccaceae bacterium]
MEIARLLPPTAVRALGPLSSKKRLFHEIAEIAAQAYGLDAAATIDALQERESLGPTGVGHGVALPHARVDGIPDVAGVFLRLDRPMDFDSVDRQPVDLVFALFAPRDSGVDHLKALALVSRTMREGATCAKLRANSDPAKLHAILTAPRVNRAA